MSSTTHHSSSSIDRKALKRPDSFIVSVSSFFNQAFQNTYLILIGLGVLLGLGIGVAFWLNHSEALGKQANSALYSAEKALQNDLKLLAPVKPADAEQKGGESSGLDRGIEFKQLDVDAQLTGSVAKLVAVTEKFPNTRAAFEAHLKLGSLYFDHGVNLKALSWYEKATHLAKSSFDQAIAWSSVGYAQENLGKPSEAIQAFQKAINLGEVGLKGDLLLAIARCYETLHDSTKARSIYDQVSSEFPGSDYSKTAEIFKAKVQ